MKMWVWALIGMVAILGGCQEDEESSIEIQDSHSPIKAAAAYLEMGDINWNFSVRHMVVDKYADVYFLKQLLSSQEYEYSLVKYNSFGVEQSIASGRDPQNYSIRGSGLTTDDLGNIFVTGSIYRGLGELSVAGESDMYLAKFDELGNRQFDTLLGGENSDSGSAIAVDKSGNIYVMGKTDASFDGNEYMGEESRNIFLVKYSANGDKIWSLQESSPVEFGITSMAIDSSGDVYISEGLEQCYVLTQAGLDINVPISIFKFSSAGVKQWTRLETDMWLDGFAVDESGYLFAIGHQKEGYRDVELTKYDLSGNKTWSKKLGWKADFCSPMSRLVILANGDILVGTTTDTDLDGNTIPDTDIVIAKYDSNGNKHWSKLLGTSYYEYLENLGVDIAGNIYIQSVLGGSNGPAGYYLIKLDPSGDQIDLNADASNDI